MSIVASLSGLIVLLIRCVKRIPRRAFSVLWIVPFLRMWVPVGIGSSYGLMSLISRFTTRTVVLYDSFEKATLSMTNSLMAANSYFPITYKVNLLENVFRVASAIWIIVFIALLITFTIIYAITQNELRDSQHFQDNIYISDKITSPAVYGIIRPKIIIPLGYENRDMTFLLLHENSHISRKDNLRRVIAFLTASLHWFNPLTWVFLKHFLADLELSCDEKVLAKCAEDQK
ncbi:MAG TPA: M56 family metallopeptidase, partial [Oscillospiraceae bacterium]|nr:M56 family metallopeptidase [Oscillospiraceae bacterium]